MGRPFIVGLSLLVIESFATTAFAGIDVRMHANPVRVCGEVHITMTLTNDSSEPTGMEITSSLHRSSREVARLYFGRFDLAAGETRVDEFDVTMPSLPQGSYTIRMETFLSDGT